MAANPKLAVTITANISALKSALELSQSEIVKTAAGAKALGSSMSGNKLEQTALQTAVAIKALGGATTLTAKEAQKADAAFQAWFDKAAKSGKEIPPELAKIAAETKKVAEEAKKAEEGAGGLFAKLSGGVAVGNLVSQALMGIGRSRR